jgi:predicted AAA+ superfamily ATPase
MAPFSFAETRQSFASPFFSALLDGPGDFWDVAKGLKCRRSLADIHEYWLKGGYPEPWVRRGARFRKAWNANYVRTYLERDVARLFPGLDHERFRQFLTMLGGLSGTILNYSDLARTLGVSQPTARDYVNIAHGTFVWRLLPAYSGNPMKRTVKHPKGYMRDTGLLHHLLRISDLDMLLGHPAMGRLWEGMVIEEILRFLNASGAAFDAYHYRTGGGGEIDLVLDGGFGLIPIEIKHTQSVRVSDLQAMKCFVADCKCRFGLIINNDVAPRRQADRIFSIPFACL